MCFAFVVAGAAVSALGSLSKVFCTDLSLSLQQSRLGQASLTRFN